MTVRHIAALALLAISVPAVYATEEIRYGEVEHKIMRKADEEGDLLVSVKVVVTNGAKEDRRVAFSAQALDAEGFEVTDVMFAGVVKGGASRTFTDTVYVHEDAFKTIVKWRTEEEEELLGD